MTRKWSHDRKAVKWRAKEREGIVVEESALA